MPVADYECSECGQVWEHYDSPLPTSIEKPHTIPSPNEDDCKNSTLNRVWSFRVGRGTSGGTPPR